MKTQHLFPIIAGVLGFAIAWTLKPAPDAPRPTAGDSSSADVPRTQNSRPSNRPSASPSLAEKRPEEVNPSEFPLADLADKGPKSRTEGKMLRLAEALDLSMDQQADIIRIVEETKFSTDAEKPLLDDLTERGRKVEQTLKETLSSEQYAKFEELRIRERDNRIESRAQQALGQLIEEIDLSPGQREEAIARLRQAERERIQEIPAAATLLLKTSVLPTGPKELTVDGVLTIAHITKMPPSGTPEENHNQYLLQQRRDLEGKLRVYEGVLTPAQMGQLHAIIAEEKAAVEQMREERDRQMRERFEQKEEAPQEGS